MPDEKGKEPASVAQSPSTEEAAKTYNLTEEQIQSLLKANSDAQSKTFKEEMESRIAALSAAKGASASPATARVSMKGAVATEGTEGDEAGPGFSKEEVDHIAKVKKFMPLGTNWQHEKGIDSDRRFYKNVNMSTAPRGEVLDNYSAGRLAFALSRFRDGDLLALSKFAPWESAYYDWVRKAQAESNGQDGGFLAPEEWVNVLFGILRPASFLEKFPITKMAVATRTQHIPTVTADVSVLYAAENAALTASQFQYSQHTLTMRKQYTFVQISNELLADSLPQAENSIRREAALAIARDRDKQAIFGNGQAGAPIGLANMTNITTTNLGATPTYSNLHTGILNVEQLNLSANVPTGEASCTGILANVQLKHTLYRTLDTQNRPLWSYGIREATGGPAGMVGTDGGLNGLLGVPVWAFSNLVPSGNSGQIIYGDWQYLVLAERQDVEIMASNVAGTAFQNDQTWIRFIYRYDVTCVHPEAFFVHTGANA